MRMPKPPSLPDSDDAMEDGGRMIRFAFVIDRGTLERLRKHQTRTGVSIAAQIRQGIRWWLDAHEWPSGSGT